MTPDETGALLMWAIGHDRRHNITDPQMAEVRHRIWATALAEVPVEFARAAMDRHYGKADAPEVKPAHILTAWRTEQRLQDSRHQDPPPASIPVGTWNRRPSWFDAYMRACDEARGDWGVIVGIRSESARVAAMAEARARVAAVPLPVALANTPMVPPNPRERRCVNHDVCVCPHTTCFDGWADAPEVVRNLHGDAYEAVRRCPACFDVVLMRGELTGKGGRRR